MIVKPFEPKSSNNPMQNAGALAEEQMAFYLKRGFAESPRIFVFNDIRISNAAGDDFAQMDHLILFPHGMFIIESKSVTTTVQFNSQGEWSRLWNNKWQGVQSPIQQARRQADFLREKLHSYRESLLRKALFGQIQRGFKRMPIHVLVAISDSGRIERSGVAEEVLKADQVVDRVNNVVKKWTPGALGWLSHPDEYSWPKLEDAELSNIKVFLLSRHRPLTVAQEIKNIEQASIPAPEKTQIKHICRHCSASTVCIEHGRYGYYFKCTACTQNTPIDFACPQCKEKARIKKSGTIFSKECQCGFSATFFENPS